MDNKKKGIGIFIAAILVISVFAVVTTPASANNGKEEAIEKGLEWLADQQDPTTGAWNLDYWPVASTAFAVLKFEHHAKYTREPSIDPFDPAYEYSDNIVKGWNYIFNHSYDIDIDPQWNGTHLLDPDVNRVNGKGIYFMSPGSDNRPLYEVGIVMMALEASCHPERVVEYGNHAGLNYSTVMKDTVDYVAWAQNDWPNAGRGGWRYGAYDNGTISGPGWGGPHSDNSVSQWPVLGLMSAEEWSIYAPDWVRTELLHHWLVFSQNAENGGFGYANNVSPNIARTASGLTQLTYCGVETDDPRWDAAAGYICTNWGSTGNIGNLYAMYGLMKAAMTAQPEIVWDFCGHEWQPEYDAWLIDTQRIEPDYSPGDPEYGSWPPQYDTTGVLATAWALLILQKVAPGVTPTPPPASVPAMTPIGLIALIGLLSVIAAISISTGIRRKRR